MGAAEAAPRNCYLSKKRIFPRRCENVRSGHLWRTIKPFLYTSPKIHEELPPLKERLRQNPDIVIIT